MPSALSVPVASGSGSHITTRPPASRIERALAPTSRRPPFSLSLRGLGWFPGDEARRVLWVGVDAQPPLTELTADTERALAEIGIAAERRPYVPHVTLARAKPNSPGLEALARALAAASSTPFGSFVVDSFTLYESHISEKGTEYRTLATVPLIPGG